MVTPNPHSNTSGGRWARLAWAALCAFIVYGSLGEWGFDQPGIWAPTLIVPRDVAINILLYVAFGVLGWLSMRGGYRGHGLRLAGRVVLLALLFSASNEAFQLYTVDRIASLTDIVSAVIGAFLGGVATAWSVRESRERSSGRRES
jgi:VanZ family protein